MAALQDMMAMLGAFDEQTSRDLQLAQQAQALYALPLQYEQMGLQNDLTRQQLTQDPNMRSGIDLLQLMGTMPQFHEQIGPIAQSMFQQLYPDVNLQQPVDPQTEALRNALLERFK